MRTSIRNTSIHVAIVSLIAAALVVPAQSAFADGLCGSEITTDGTTITLSSDLYCVGQGIVVRASDVTIDLQGHTIAGDGPQDYDPEYGYPAGVTVFDAINTRIVRGNIKGFTHGIRVTRSESTLIEGVTTNNTRISGIELDTSSGISLLGLTLTGEGRDIAEAGGIVGTQVKNVSAKDIVAKGWFGTGVNFNLVTGLLLTRVVAHDNGGEGINVGFSQGRVQIGHTTAVRNLYGIRLDNGGSASSVVITDSTASGNERHGIYLVNMPNAKIANDTARANGGDGIRVESGTGVIYDTELNFVATIDSSRVNGNHGSGITLASSGTPKARWRVVRNDAESNRNSGFVLYGGRAALKENTSNGNGSNGYTWSKGSVGSSAHDVSKQNRRHGVLVDAHAGNTVTVKDASVINNRSMGLMAASGTVKLRGGKYYSNGLDGVRASAGSVYADRATLSENGGNGIAFLPGANGAIRHISASVNGRYGICVDRTAHVRDVPPHILNANTLGPRGSACTG